MLGLIDLFKELRRCKVMRRRWKIDWTSIMPIVDKTHYMFYILPTVSIKPWTRRHKESPILIVSWLNVSLFIGKWNRRPKEDFKNV